MSSKEKKKEARRQALDRKRAAKQREMKTPGGGGKYGAKIEARRKGERPAIAAGVEDSVIRADRDIRADWEIARREETGFKAPKQLAKQKIVEDKVLQTNYYRGPAGFDTELVFVNNEKLIILAVNDTNRGQSPTSLLAVQVGEKEQEWYFNKTIKVPVWEVKRLTGFKAANDGLKSAELLGKITMSENRMKVALERWSSRYGLTEVASNMAAPISGALVVHKPLRGSGRHHRM
ncbi:MAG: hypothetical protein R3D88_05200 [Alphaproteobacteria bacterium]